MRPLEIPLGEWLPDMADYSNPGLAEAINVYPAPDGYVPFQGPSLSGDTTTEVVRGARTFVQDDKTRITCAGSSTRLYLQDGATLHETTGYTALAANSAWRFARFNNLVVAVSPENVPQYLADIETSTTWAALPGTPPQAAVAGRVNDWLVLGDLTDTQDGGAVVPNRVRWSAFNNPTASWATDRGELSDFRDLDPAFGHVTGIVGGPWGIVFQERAIWRMTFVGAPRVFDFEQIADDRGCIAPDSIVNIGNLTYFLDRGGFFVTNGATVEPIGDNKVNQWFEENSDSTGRELTHGSINWPRRCIVWAYPVETGAGYTQHLVYNVTNGRWSGAELEVNWLVNVDTQSLTLDEAAVLFPGGVGDSDIPIGSLTALAGRQRLGAFVPSGSGSELAFLTGDALAARFTTGDASIAPGRRSLVNGVMPILKLYSGDLTCSVLSRERQGQTPRETTPTAPGVDQYCPQHIDGLFHAVRLRIGAGAAWDKATTMLVRVKPTGYR